MAEERKRSKSERERERGKENPSVCLVFFRLFEKTYTYIYIEKKNPLKKKDNVIITVRDNCLGTREKERERERRHTSTHTLRRLFSMPRKNRDETQWVKEIGIHF